MADLQNPGDYITTQILDQLVFVIRGKDKKLHAYYNVCMHRGHVLLEGKGNVGMIQCPFHAWTYSHDGKLKAAGNAENVADFDHDDFSLASVQVEEFLHMVFVNLDWDAPSLASQAGGLADMVNEVLPNLHELKHVRRDTYELRANWKLMGDQLECYHCPVIHPQVMGGEDSYLDFSFDSEEHGLWSVDISWGTDEVDREDPQGPAVRHRTGIDGQERLHLVSVAEPAGDDSPWRTQLQGRAGDAERDRLHAAAHGPLRAQRSADRL